MTDPVFVDTNVLLYRHDTRVAEKQATAADWLDRLWLGRSGRTSQQVLNEFYYQARRQKHLGLTPEYAREIVSDLEAWAPAPLDLPLLRRAWDVESRFGFSFWDSLIVAAAQSLRCRFLLTEDLQHGQDLDGVTVLNPFIDPPRTRYASEVHDDTSR